jgi:hypothetical protein
MLAWKLTEFVGFAVGGGVVEVGSDVGIFVGRFVGPEFGASGKRIPGNSTSEN